MARGKSKQQSAAVDAEQDASLPKGAVVDARTELIYAPLDTVSSEPEAVQSTDTVAEVLAGNYSEGIVDEVKKYAKAEWDVEPSSLDPLDDIETFYDYDFKLPPEDYDAYQAAAKLKLDQLEELKDAPDPATAAKIAARKELVKGKTTEDLRWLKHKAYYRGVQHIRAGKAATAAEAEAAAAAAPATPQQQQQPSQPTQHHHHQQQQQQRYAHLSDDEVLAAVSEPSEWDMSWTGKDYTKHPKVLQQLRTTFSNGLGLPAYKSAAEQEAEIEAAWQATKAAEAAAQKQAEEEEAAKQALLKKYRPYQAYTPQYLEQQRRDKVLAAHRRTKQQAFWLSLGLALGSSAYRWWQQRGSSKRRRGSVAGQRQAGGSRRSTRPPTPSSMSIQGVIAE